MRKLRLSIQCMFKRYVGTHFEWKWLCIKELPVSFLPWTCSLSKKKKVLKAIFFSRTSLSVRCCRSYFPFLGPSPGLNIIAWNFSFAGNSPMGGFPSAFQLNTKKKVQRLDWFDLKQPRLLSCLQWPGSETELCPSVAVRGGGGASLGSAAVEGVQELCPSSCPCAWAEVLRCFWEGRGVSSLCLGLTWSEKATGSQNTTQKKKHVDDCLKETSSALKRARLATERKQEGENRNNLQNKKGRLYKHWKGMVRITNTSVRNGQGNHATSASQFVWHKKGNKHLMFTLQGFQKDSSWEEHTCFRRGKLQPIQNINVRPGKKWVQKKK